MEISEAVVHEDRVPHHLDPDFVIIHDPQPLPMIIHYRKSGPWIWRCHIELTNPNRDLWNYLAGFIEKYDAVILTLKEYAQALAKPQIFFMAAIDPFTITNREPHEAEI